MTVDPAQLARAYQEGLTLAQCQARFGISGTTAARILNGAGVVRRPPGRRPGRTVDPAELARAYRDGLSLRRCSARFGISANTVAKILGEAGVALRPAGQSRHPVDPAELARAYRDEGLTVAQCSARFGISGTTFARILDAAGVVRRPPGRRPAHTVDPADLARAYRDGLSLQRCSARFGISGNAIVRILDDAGVVRRPPGPAPRGTADPAELAQAYREQGLTVAQCRDRFGISARSVVRILADAGVARRPGGR